MYFTLIARYLFKLLEKLLERMFKLLERMRIAEHENISALTRIFTAWNLPS
jgi:hypothetical protein